MQELAKKYQDFEGVFFLRRHHWQAILLAFLVGVLTSYVFLLFSIRIGHPSLGLVIDFDQESPWGPSNENIGSDWPCRKPAKLGLSPRALTDMTGDPLATPDKLIVAARHSDVRQSLHPRVSPSTHYSCSLFLFLQAVLGFQLWSAFLHEL